MKTAVKLTAGVVLTTATVLAWAGLSAKTEPVGTAPAAVPATQTALRAVSAPSRMKSISAACTAQAPLTPARLTEEQAAALANLEALLELENGSADTALTPLREWAATDPAAAAQWVAENLEGAARRRALTEVIALWAARSPLQALAWLDAQPTHEGNEEPYTAAFSSLAADDPSAASGWLQQHPDLTSRENYEILFSHWTSRDAPAATDWLQANLDPAMQEALLPTVLTGLHDPAAAASLLAAVQPSNPDASLAAASGAAGLTAPQYAMDLANQISDDTARAVLAENIQRDFAPAPSASAEIQQPTAAEPAPPVAVE